MSRLRRRIATGLLAGLLLLSPAVATAHRWAILADSSLRESGLTALLFAELAKTPGLELVARERLDEVLAELDLDALDQARETSRRLNLGQLVAADRLIIVRQDVTSVFATDVIHSSEQLA